jgi:hypothetical protein
MSVGGGYDYLLDDKTGKIKSQFMDYNITINENPPTNPQINDIWIDVSGST